MRQQASERIKMIRQAVITDLDAIEEGYREHFLHEKQYGAYTVFQEGVYPTRRDAEKALSSEALYVYEENGVVMGSMILDKQQPDEYGKVDWPGKTADEHVSVIHLLMVRPCASGKGIGSALLKFAEEEARRHSCTVLRLDTGEQNIPAAALYKKLGFQLAATASMNVGGIIAHNGHLFFQKVL